MSTRMSQPVLPRGRGPISFEEPPPSHPVVPPPADPPALLRARSHAASGMGFLSIAVVPGWHPGWLPVNGGFPKVGERSRDGVARAPGSSSIGDVPGRATPAVAFLLLELARIVGLLRDQDPAPGLVAGGRGRRATLSGRASRVAPTSWVVVDLHSTSRRWPPPRSRSRSTPGRAPPVGDWESGRDRCVVKLRGFARTGRGVLDRAHRRGESGSLAQRPCLNMNHRRDSPVAFCPDCGEVVNARIPRRSCGEASHAKQRRGRSHYCVDRGEQLIRAR